MANEKERSLSYFHQGGDEPLLWVTIPNHFRDIAEDFAGREAVVSRHQGRRLTYRALSNQIDALAKGLLGLGFKKGDRIGVWSTDNIEWLLVQMATARIGAILVNINPAYRPRELAFALERSQVQGLFLIPAFRSSDYVEMISSLIPELRGEDVDIHNASLPDLRRVFLFDPASPMETTCPYGAFTLWQNVLEAGCGVDDAKLDRVTASLDPDEAINIQYTSGTTGFPKAVVLSHHNLINNAWFTARIMGFDETGRLCVPVPFYHCFGMVLANLMCLSVGSCIVIPAEHFDAEATLAAIAEENCTALHGVPTMFIAELEHPHFQDFDLTSLRTGIMAGAPCPEPLMKRVMNDMHCREILIGYGQTEAAPLTHLTRPDDSIDRRTQTVGRNLPHQEVKIISTDDDRTVQIGQPGEVCFRGYHVMQGYFADPEATKEAKDENGWLHSGDIGVMDADGYLRITGRLKEMIIRGGENIYPAEVEACLFKHPKIAQAAVFGIPDELMGEEIMAWIQLHAGEKASEREIRDFCEDRLAHFKIPGSICFVDDFPTTVTGKIQKFRMREIALKSQDPK
jgi:fatty-acyl-CoA synthase